MKKAMLIIGVVALGSCVKNTSSKINIINVKDTITKDTIIIVKDTTLNVFPYGIDISDPENIPDSLWWDYVPEGEK